MTKNTTVTLDEAVANSAALAAQWAILLPKVKARMQELCRLVKERLGERARFIEERQHWWQVYDEHPDFYINFACEYMVFPATRAPRIVVFEYDHFGGDAYMVITDQVEAVIEIPLKGFMERDLVAYAAELVG